MPASSNIQYVAQKDIDKKKWDNCIEKAENGLIYSYSFYLDHMARYWDALVLNDYEAVMPLTWNKKYGISYLYQPAFVAAAGVFGTNISPTIVEEFIKSIPDKYRLIEISLNPGNSLPKQSDQIIVRDNYILSLKSSYEQLYKSYRESHKRNIRRAEQAGCYCKKNVPIDDIIGLNKEQLKNLTKISEDDYANFKQLFNYLSSKGMAESYGIYNIGEQPLASCAYFFSHGRAYYIIVGNHPDRKTIGASHFLIDRFIADHAEKNLTLDFEGTDIRNLAFFYGGFGAAIETYPALRINNLPWWVKWAKR